MFQDGELYDAGILNLRRWQWRFCALLVFSYLMEVVVGSASDWTHNCPSNCVCLWTNGKKTADCHSAGYTSVPMGLSEEVQVLDLRGNAITRLRSYEFREAGLLNLNKVKLTQCKIEEVDRLAFAELKLLVELDLSENRIRKLAMESFETNERLREVQLNGNPLAQLLGVGFPPLQHFQKLNLRGCNLTTIPPRAFEKLTNLEQLDLSANQFEFLSQDLFVNLKKLKAMGLQENPWNCDCRLKSFRDWFLSNKLLQVQSPKCAQPDLAHYEWSQLEASHFACAPEIATLHISDGGLRQATEAYIVGDVGKAIRLDCLVKATPPADVRWIKDNISMTNATAASQGRSYYVHISGDEERWVNLTIPTSETSDAGDYTCVARNKGGVAEKNITLNFEDVPSGAGVGMVGTGGPMGADARSWLWILIGSLCILLCLSLLLILFCYCSRRRRLPKTSRAQDMKVLQQEPLIREETNGDIVRIDAQSESKEGTTPLLSPSRSYSGAEADSDYPDLLHLPMRRLDSPHGSIGSTLPDSTRLLSPQQPQTLNPRTLYDPSRHAPAIYAHPHLLYGRPNSPYSGSVASFQSEPPQAIVPPPHRPGYVTLPRRPRVPSWSPASNFSPRDAVSTPLCVSPTGSSILLGGPYVKYDNLGPRTTADGSSKLSLNKLDGANSTAPTPTHYYSATLPSYPKSPLAQFSFDPILENDGNDAFPSNYGLPREGDSGGRGFTETPEVPGTGKKVPPKPPPKPSKKRDETHSPSPGGEDGTEV